MSTPDDVELAERTTAVPPSEANIQASVRAVPPKLSKLEKQKTKIEFMKVSVDSVLLTPS